MNVVVVGGGAMGGIFAGHLAAVGETTTVLEASAEIADRINEFGIELVRGDSSSSFPLAATLDPEVVEDADLVIVFVKAHQTAAVAGSLGEHLSSRTTVVSLQNGWGNAEVLARHVRSEQMAVGVTYHSGTVLGPGRIGHTGSGPTFVGPYRPADGMDRADKVAETLVRAGIESTATGEVRKEIWKKLVLNAATLPVAATTGLRAAEILDVAEVALLVDRLAVEAVLVARATGLELEIDERIERIHTVLRGAGQGKPSMLQDIEARRKTEIEVVNQAVVRAAEQCGVEAPLSSTMCALVHGIERSWTR